MESGPGVLEARCLSGCKQGSSSQHGQGELNDFRKSGHVAKVDSQYYTVCVLFFLCRFKVRHLAHLIPEM